MDGQPGDLTPPRPAHRLPGLGSGPVDHAWVDNGEGILCCVAGDRHTVAAIAACPYYLRADVAAGIEPAMRPGVPAGPGTPLIHNGAEHWKITGLVAPDRWRDFVASLPPHHGLSPSNWSLLSILDTAHVAWGTDPRAALRSVFAQPAQLWRRQLLTDLCTALDDPGNEQGTLGLSGSVALDPARIEAAADLDLLIYRPASTTAASLRTVVRGLGGQFLADLDPRGQRFRGYQQSRLMPAVVGASTAPVFRARRHDVAWIGDTRIDLTWATPTATVAGHLPYEHPAVGAYEGRLRLTEVTDQFPVTARVQDTAIEELHVTARGLQESLAPGDELTVRGLLHNAPDGGRFVSVDDATDHHLDLATSTEP